MRSREGKKGKKEKREKKEGKGGSILPGVMAVATVAAVIIYLVLINAAKSALSDYEKGTVYAASGSIPKGTLITADNFNGYFRAATVDASVIPAAAITDPGQLDGLVARVTLDQGTFATSGLFETLDEVTAGMEDPVIAGVKAEDLSQMVGGVLRAGDRIHVYVVSGPQGTGGSLGESQEPPGSATEAEAVPAWSSLYVVQAFDASGVAIDPSDTVSSAQRINIYLDNSDVAEFYEGLASGSLRVVKDCGE